MDNHTPITEHEPTERACVRAGRLGGLTAWARQRERMLRAAARGNDALMRKLGNKTAVKLHFMRLAERRWKLEKGEDYDW